MSVHDEVYLTSRSRAPSVVDVTSQNEQVFGQLPDLIQEAVVSTEFASPKLRISRVQNDRGIDVEFMTRPMFFITSRTDSGIDMPDLNVTDEKVLGKYGSDLTANFADIKACGPKAFFQKKNLSDGIVYSLCTCATGYIWVYVSRLCEPSDPDGYSDLEIQIGTYALKSRAITTIEIPCRYQYYGREDPLDGQLALFFSTILAKYLRNRMMGQQYEEATESAISLSRDEGIYLGIVHLNRFQDLNSVMRRICSDAPMPPISDVSLISRSMINGRWQCWREGSVLRRRYFFPQRVIRCFKRSRHDPIDLLSGYFKPHTSKNPEL